MALLFALALLAPPVQAAPVRNLWIAGAEDGSLTFAEDLASLWASRNGPTPERLAPRVEPKVRERLRAVNRGRADLAIVSADEAARLLPEYPRVKVIALLWPLYLHAVTRNESVQALRLPLTVPVWTLESAAFAHDSLWEWGGDGANSRSPLELFPADWLPDALGQLRGEVLLFAAPAPLREVTEELQRDAMLHLVLFDAKTLEEFRVRYPWLRTAALTPGVYPRMRAPVEVPVRFQVLAGRQELPEATVRKALDTVYGARESAASINPLFAQMRPENNASFSPLLPFHPAAALVLNLNPPAR